MNKKALFAAILTVMFIAGSNAYAQGNNIIVYGQNSTEWNRKMGVNETRGTCNKTPDLCMVSVRDLLREQNTQRFTLNLIADPKTVVDYAAQYSKLSLSEPRLSELSLDDFPDHFNIWNHTPGTKADVLLRQVIEQTKSKNPKLKFGITIYEDQLIDLVANPSFNAELRGRIDTVHLYLHFRGNAWNYENYVRQVKKSFPNASVIAGAYPYDRVDYRACMPSNREHCSTAQELDLFKQALTVQVRLLKSGVVSGLEFYPGFFGWEEKYAGWNDPAQCSPQRRQECIDDTKAMHQTVLQLLNSSGRP